MDIQNARRLFEQGQLVEAEAAYRRLVNDPLQRAEAFYGLGMVSLTKKDSQAAAHWFTKSLETNPKEENALYYLADIAAGRGDKDSAIRLFAGVLTLNPRHVGALNRLG